ncbi:MAG TPA: hypothetical protein EYP23_07140, partial [Thermoplasmata archaeon]|nr:hypothetical protein [Thermoplasmata archaeon]
MEEKRRVYYSFYDIPQRESFTPSYGVTSHQSITSRTEIMHLLIAIIVLSIAFSFPLGGGGIIEGLNVVKEAMDKYPIALFSIITGFFFHELSHKFIAQRYGLWAEFRMYPGGLLFAFLFGLLIGFV